MSISKDKISVVTSLYRSEPYIVEFHKRHVDSLKRLDVDFEFVFVNDGSPDNSVEIVRGLINKFDQVKLVELSRNFGQYAAMFAGLAHATGNYIYAVDSDLEEHPENIVLFYQEIKAHPESDVVFGVLKNRLGGYFRKTGGKIFYLILDSLSDVKVPRDQPWQRIMTRRYVQALLQYNEVGTLPAGLMILTGFTQLPLLVEKSYKGSSSYSIGKRAKLAINAVTAFSSAPLIFVGLFGFGITLVSFCCLMGILVTKLFFLDFQAGWLSLIGSIWLVGGLLLSSLGVIGVYLSKVFGQVKNRPLYIVKDISTSESFL